MHFELRQQLKQRRENGERNLIIDRGSIVHSNKKSSNPDSFLGGRNRYIVPKMVSLNASITNTVNNVRNMFMPILKSIEAQTNIFSSTFFLCHHLLILKLTEYVSWIVFLQMQGVALLYSACWK